MKSCVSSGSSVTSRGVAAALAIVLGAPAAVARPLPPPGPPPDPSRGDTYDGRRRPRESLGRELALFVPRAILIAPRLALALARIPAIAIMEYTEEADEARRRSGRRRARGGWSPVVTSGDGDYPGVGARYWNREVLGAGRGGGSVWAQTSGPRYLDGGVRLSPNPARTLAMGGWVRGWRRTDARVWDLAGEEDPTLGAVERRAEVVAFEGTASLVWRPGGAGGGWRTTLLAGVGVRRFAPGVGGMAVDPMTTPGFEDGATFARAGVVVDRIGTFDVSRGLAGLDVSLAAQPTVGVGAGDRSRYLTTTLQAAYGVPVGGGRAVVLSGIVGDQLSWGEDDPTFYDRLSPGAYGFLRGFPTTRFRGGAVAAAALDVRVPLAMNLDGFVFVEEGGAFPEHFEEIDAGALHTSVGGGVRFFWQRNIVELMVGWGVGEGLNFGFSFDTGS